MKIQSTFPELLQGFFTERLMSQCNASPHTVASYRDTFRLLINFARCKLKKAPTALSIQDLDAPFVGRFLDSLEKERGNTSRTRNVRLAAIRSFFAYVSFQEPGLGAVAQRVLAIQNKRGTTKPVDFLSRAETDALLSVPNQDTWTGRRDYTLLLVAVQTGLRVSELTGLRCQDVTLGTGAHVRCTGKGRKTRSIPLRHETIRALQKWLRERAGQPGDPLFPSVRGNPLSRDGVEYLISQHTIRAKLKCPSLETKRVSPHVLRHTTAMDLLQHGVDRAVIALWLGHESLETTQVYLHANLELKEAALAKTQPFGDRPSRYRPPNKLMAFLQSL